DRRGAACAFGHVLARHFDVNPAGVSALATVHIEEQLDLLEDALERPRLEARGSGDRIAVHRITGPHDRMPLLAHGPDELRQMRFDLVRAEPAYQCQSSRLVLRIEQIDEPEQSILVQRRSALQPDRVADATAELDMGVIRLAGAV